VQQLKGYVVGCLWFSVAVKDDAVRRL